MFLASAAFGALSLLSRAVSTKKSNSSKELSVLSCIAYSTWSSPANVELRLYDDGKFRFFANFPSERLIWVAMLGCCSDSTQDSIGSPFGQIESPNKRLSVRILDYRFMILLNGNLAWSHRQGKTGLLLGASLVTDLYTLVLRSPSKAYELRLYNDDLKIVYAEAILWSAANSVASCDSCTAIYTK